MIDSADQEEARDEQEFINEYARPVTVTVSDGNAFKSVVGDQPMTPGGRYFFEVAIKSGCLIKIGVCRRSIDPEKVSQLARTFL